MKTSVLFKIVCACIFLVALFLRVWGLHDNPPGFFADEASVGYNAYLILTTGKDEFGETLPLFFRTFGHYKGPFEVYTIIPFIALFGLTVEAVRLTSVAVGIGTMVSLYILGKEYASRWLGLILAGVFGLIPWAVHLNRTGFTANNLMVLYIVASFIPLQRYFKTKELKQMILFALVAGFGTYTYFPARMLIPTLVGVVFVYALWQKEQVKNVFFAGLTYSLVLIPLLLHMFLGNGLQRWNEVSIWNHPDIVPSEHITTNVLLHFSPEFLFTQGDAGLEGQFVTRHSILGLGQLYLWQIPFILFGVAWLAKKDKKLLGLVLFLLLLYPIPSSLSLDRTPQATRAILGIIPFTLLTGVGVWASLSLAKVYSSQKYLLLYGGVICLAIVISLSEYTTHFEEYPAKAADYWGWQYGGEEIMEYVVAQGDSYDQYVLTGMFNGAHIVYAFFDPEKNCDRCVIQGVDLYRPEMKQLFVMREVEYERERARGYVFDIVHGVYLPNGQREFVFAEIVGDL